jgi:hypothetical protein
LASSKVEKCSFADTSAGITIGGAVSMTNGKIRSDFDASSNGTTMGTHMIALGQDVYVWTDGATTGSVSSLGVGYGPTAKPTVNGLNLDQKMAYVCTPWTVDASRFVLPSSVKFSKI